MSVARKKFKSMASHEMSTKPGGESNDRNDFGFSNNGNSVTEYCDEKIETHSHPGLILESSNFDEPVSVPRVIALPPDKPEVTIGRSVLVDHCICSVSISRLHAIFTQSENGMWHVCDKSVNGVFLNGKKLTPNSSYPLCNGDAVRLSPFTAPGVSYKFCFNLKRYEPETEQQNTNKIEPHTMITSESWDVRPSDTLKDYKSNTQPTTTVVNSRLNAKIRNASELRSDDDDVITPKKQILIKRNSELEIALQTAQRQLEEYKRRNSVQSSEQVEVDKAELEKLREREAILKAQLEAQMLKAEEEHQTALKEKETLEKMLAHHQEELNRGISFQQEKERMELALLEKDMECRLLQRALDGLRAQHNESGNQDSKNEVVKLFSDMVETELQCSICSELFVKATTLNCSHSFCEYCIKQWMKTKKECPFCRKPVTNTSLSQVLDSFIDKITEKLSVELKDRRKELVAERKAIAAREEAELGAPSGSTNVVTRSGRRSTRGRQRGTAASGTRGRGRPRQSTQNQASLITAHVLPIEISSDSSDNGDTTYYDSTILSDDSSSDVDYIPGVGDEYYGGYGTCFNCGHRGHWANGCPF